MTEPVTESGWEPRAPAQTGATRPAGGAARLAERAVLTALLYRPYRVADLGRWLRASDFADPQHADLYTTITRMHAAGALHPTNPAAGPSDPTTRSAILGNILAVQDALQGGRFTDPQPHLGIRELLDATPTSAPELDVRYGQMVLESSARRRLHDWAVYFREPARAPAYNDEHRELSPVHDGLTADLADFQQRSAQSVNAPELANLAQLTEVDTPTIGGQMVVPAAAPAHKLVERAERDILAAVLSDTTGQHQHIRDRLEPADFTASPRHAATWRAVQALVRQAQPVNAITTAWESERLPAEYGPALTADELVDLTSAPPPSHLRRQITMVARASLYYRSQAIGEQLTTSAQDRTRDVEQILTEAQDSAAALRDQTSRLAGERAPAALAHRIRQLNGEAATRQR